MLYSRGTAEFFRWHILSILSKIENKNINAENVIKLFTVRNWLSMRCEWPACPLFHKFQTTSSKFQKSWNW